MIFVCTVHIKDMCCGGTTKQRIVLLVKYYAFHRKKGVSTTQYFHLAKNCSHNTYK